MQRTHGSFGDHAAVPPSQNAAARAAAFSYPPTPQDWVKIQGPIFEYYVLQNLPLHDVRDMLHRKHGFKASERMIKARLSKWEFSKNAKREDWGYLAILLDQRRRERKLTVFDVRGHRKTVKDLHRFIRNQNISADRFLAESLEIHRQKGERIPKHIRAFTPDAEDLQYSTPGEELRAQGRSPSPSSIDLANDTIPDQSPGSSGNSPRLTNSHIVRRPSTDIFEHHCPYQSYATEQHHCSPKMKSPVTTSAKSVAAHHRSSLQLYSSEKTRLELEACSSQLLEPVPLKSRIGHNDMRCWTIISRVTSSPSSTDAMDITDHGSDCAHPTPLPFPSLGLFEPKQEQRNILNDSNDHPMNLPTSMRNEGSWVWVSLCFLACMSLGRGDEKFAQSVLDEAQKKFQKLLKARDPLLLTAAGLMMAILHQHDQGAITIRILNCAKAVAEEVLHDPEDPVRITIYYLSLAADGSGKLLKDAGFTAAYLESVYRRLRASHSDRHPYTIAAHHNYAWMLKFEGEHVIAEWHARKTFEESKACFGIMHMQTMTSLSVTAGCIAEQVTNQDKKERAQECIHIYREIIVNATQILGVIHPYTLEAQRRLAAILEGRPDQMGTVLKLNRTLVFGKATMLGRQHPFTVSQRADYEDLLQRTNRWQDDYGNPSKEQKEVEDLFTKDPEDVWELVERFDDIIDVNLGRERSRAEANVVRHEEEWSRSAMSNILSRSRSVSPTSSTEYEAY